MHGMYALRLVGATAVLCGFGCSKASTTCGPGTALKDGVCVVAAPLVSAAAAPSSTASATEGDLAAGCETACKRRASCIGLNAEAPLIVTRCKNECAEMAKGDASTVRDLIACRMKESCEHVTSCDAAYEKTAAKTARAPDASDPVLITKSAVSAGDYGVGKEIHASYKNNSAKDVDGVKFMYYCSNNFDEPGASGRLIEQDKILAGSSRSGVWSIYEDTCSKVNLVVSDVHYVDGTTWAP
jgi:hypothetical protein